MVFLGTAVACEFVDVCDVRSMDRDMEEAFPGMLEGLIEMCQVWRTALGSVISKSTFEGHAVGRESICCNNVNNLVNPWSVMVPKREPHDIGPQSFDHHCGTLAWNRTRIR